MKTYSELKSLIDQSLISLFENLKNTNRYHYTSLLNAMEYSVLNGGKRIRPVLLLMICEALGENNFSDAMPLSIGLELIHSYSLVHDDMPCMDNDDIRRGKPTTHKQYGEGMGLLVGDALLNLACEVMAEGLESAKKKDEYAKAMSCIMKKSGYSGMIGGQAVDISFKEICKKIRDKEEEKNKVLDMYEGKTSALFMAAAGAGALMAHGGSNEVGGAVIFANSLGNAFQIKDDMLERVETMETIGKSASDIKNNKITILSYLEIEDASMLFDYYSEIARKNLDIFKDKSKELEKLLDYLIHRHN